MVFPVFDPSLLRCMRTTSEQGSTGQVTHACPR